MQYSNFTFTSEVLGVSKFKFIETNIKDLFVIEPMVFQDQRGYFMETYNKKEFEENNLTMNFVQDNCSKSKKGVLRGLHFQTKYSQGKLVRALKGEIFDVAVDLRVGSETYGKYFSVFLSEENKKQLYVPEGFAHGFLVLSDEAEFAYKCTEFYHPEYDSGVIWNDKDLNIDWPIHLVDEVILSEKDKKLMSFSELCEIDGVRK